MKNIKKLIALFERYARAQDYGAAFTELLDSFLIPMKWHENAEDQQLALKQLDKLPKKDLLVALMTEIGEQAENFGDPLRELYQQLLSKGRHGQFFTPEHLSDLIAQLVEPDELQTCKKVIDPACGSGRMLLAAAKRNRHLLFYGADVDIICCKMAVINLLLNSLAGEIAHMNSLSNEFFRGYKTGAILKDGHYYPFYSEFTDPQESEIWLRPVIQNIPKKFEASFEPSKSPLMSQGVQGSLFEQK